MQLLSRLISMRPINVVKVNKQFRNFAKALNQERVAALNQDTLTGRILLYLNMDQEKYANPSKNNSEMLRYLRHNVNNLRNLSTHEIINFSSSLTNRNVSRNQLVSALRELDTECYSRISELSSSDILKLLNVYMSVIPNRITDFKFYNHSIKILFNSVHKLNKKDLLQLIFYVGLKKKNLESQTMLRECLARMDGNFIANLSAEELCIICSSTFKTSTKIMNHMLLDKVRKYINDNLFILKDPALFITLIKTVRHNRYQDENLLNTISCATIFNKTVDMYSFPAFCHIVALYADYFYYDENFFDVFIKNCMQQLGESSFISKKKHVSEQLRGKDIKRFLWVLSMFSELNLVSRSDIQNVIIPKLIERIEAREFENYLDSLIDIALYLWIINYRPYELVPYILSEKNRLLSTNPKTNLRLNLLLYSISIEDPDLSKKLPVKPNPSPSSEFSRYQLYKRPLLQRVLSTLHIVKHKLDLSNFEFTQEIPHLNIVGITGYRDQRKKAVYVELLDDYTRIKNVEEDVPVGLMALKLRLLERSAEGLLTVSQKEIENMTDAELCDYLADELHLIC